MKELKKYRTGEFPATTGSFSSSDFPPEFLEILQGCLWYLQQENGSEYCRYTAGVQNLTGYSSKQIEQFPGRIYHLVTPEDTPGTLRKLNEFLASPEAETLELIYSINHKDGTKRWLKENITVSRDALSKPVSMYGVITDVTQMKEKELKVIESEATLRDLNETKDRFINILSHDLRAPFTSILGFAEILLNEPNLPQADKQEYISFIYEASQSQLQFISYLLDWSRLRSGSMKVEPQRVNAGTLVHSCISSLTGNAIRKGIEIKADIPEELFVRADERLITQTIMNLLGNALKFSFENSVIEVSANLFNETLVEFVVKDKGIGIPVSEQHKLFRLDKAYSRDGTNGEKGSGFGLALVKEIIEKHSGDIWFYSEEGKGSEFHFTLPLPSNLVLLVNGNEEERSSYQHLFRTQLSAVDCLEANNGFEALSRIEEYHPSVIITEHNMPLMNGLQLVEAVRRSEQKSKTAIIVVGDQIPPDAEKKYHRLGVNFIFRKPIIEEDFVDIIREITG